MATHAQITEDEAALYDRQIRLWGLEAQQRMRNSNILVAGMRALSNEVCKNLVLAGVGAVTILDHEAVTAEDLGAQFFLTETDLGKNRAQAAAERVRLLNPRVTVTADTDHVSSKPDEFFADFDVVCLTNSDLKTLLRLDTLCRANEKAFYASRTLGMLGYIFCDVGHHTYIEERKDDSTSKNQESETKRTKKVEDFVSLEGSLQRDWSDVPARKLKKRVSPVFFAVQLLFKFQNAHARLPIPGSADDLTFLKDLRDTHLKSIGVVDPLVMSDDLVELLASTAQAELAPVCAIVGGVLAQDILKVLSGKELPIQNWFLYNGLDGSGLVHQIETGKTI